MLNKYVCLVFVFLFAHSCMALEPNTYIAFIGGFSNPYTITITPNGLYGYVCDLGSNSVLVIDTDPSSPNFNTLIAAPNLNGVFNIPTDIAITPNSTLAYVCDQGSDSVLVIDTDPASPTFNMLVAAPNLIDAFYQPNSIAITPDGLYAYVTNGGNDSVSVIDIPSNTVLSTPALDAILSAPFATAITPNGQYAYISNLAGLITVIDTNPLSPSFNTPVLAPGLAFLIIQPEGFAITPDGKYAYVSDGSGAAVIVIDTDPTSPTFNTVLSAPNLANSFNDPNGVAVLANGNYAYVTNFLGASGSISSVSVIDTNPSSPTYNSTLNTPGLSLGFLTRFVSLTATPSGRFVYALDAYNETTDVIYTGADVPRNFTGCTIANQFLLQIDYVNHLQWSAPAINTITAYKIYRDAQLTQLVATVPAPTTQYDDHNRQLGVNNTYYIVSVDESGFISAPASTVVAQLCSLARC